MIINVDKDAILKYKVTESDIIKEAFDKLMLDNTPVNSINFMNVFRSCSPKTMLENLSYLYQINTVPSINLFNMLIENSDMTIDELNNVKECSINWFCGDKHDLYYNDNPTLANIISVIDKKINECNDLSKIKSEIQFKFDCERTCAHCATMETYLADDLEVIMYNINENPEVIDEFERIVRDIKIEPTNKYLNSYPMILESSTKLILNTRVRVTGDVLDLLTSIPTVIVDKLKVLKLNKTQLKAYIRMYDKQIVSIYAELKKGDATKYIILSTYVKKLLNAKNILSEMSDKTSVTEGIAEMQHEVGAEDITVVRQNLEFDMQDALTDFIFDDEEDDEKLFESFKNIYLLADEYVGLTEKAEISGRPKTSTKIVQKIADKNRKAGVKLQAAANNIARTKHTISKSFEPINNAITKIINDIKEKDKKQRTEEIVTGKYHFKLFRVIKQGLLAIGGVIAGFKAGKFAAGLTWAALSSTMGPIVGTIVAAITILTGVAIDKRIDRKHRQQILNEMESELKIVNEKLKDADSDGNREAKYQLMRIQQKLEKDIERVKYNLK